MEPQVTELTSGASGRILPLLRNLRRYPVSFDSLRRSLIFIQSIFLWFVLFVRQRRVRRSNGRRREEEDTIRRRKLAEEVEMVEEKEFRSATALFYGVRRNALFVRSWFPVDGEMKGILVIIHGLNEHSGRYAQFAKQLTVSNFGVYAMDWIGHGGSDGLHGYVPSLDHVVADTD